MFRYCISHLPILILLFEISSRFCGLGKDLDVTFYKRLVMMLVGKDVEEGEEELVLECRSLIAEGREGLHQSRALRVSRG